MSLDCVTGILLFLAFGLNASRTLMFVSPNCPSCGLMGPIQSMPTRADSISALLNPISGNFLKLAISREVFYLISSAFSSHRRGGDNTARTQCTLSAGVISACQKLENYLGKDDVQAANSSTRQTPCQWLAATNCLHRSTQAGSGRAHLMSCFCV